MDRRLNVALVGCGRVGARRARNLAGARLVHCIDSDLARAAQLAVGHDGCLAGTDWRAALDRHDVDAVLVATTHDALALIARAAITTGRHVLLEKPGARHADELLELPDLAQRHDVRVRVGFNHRYHRAFRQARQLFDSGVLGAPLFVRARYGHGGRPGYEGEWRAQPTRSGGGELLDQGVHLIDLARWFLGEFVSVAGFVHSYYWNMPVEDNGFLLLRTATERVAFMHASCTDWKNTFSWELCGHQGKLQIEGLGGSYGTERLCWYQMLPGMGPPATTIWEYPMADDSWSVEMGEFLADIDGARAPAAGLTDAIAALRIVARVYAECAHDHRA